MATFEAYSPEVQHVLQALRAGNPVEADEGTTERVSNALWRFEETIAENARSMSHDDMGESHRQFHRPGPKSALFARLLEGKEPLPFPPPTSFSYPWYDLVELPGPHTVSSVGGTANLAALLNGDMGTGCERKILINQCVWGGEHANAAAEELLAIEEEFSRRSHAEPALAPFWQRIQDAYRANPVFIVRYGRWEPFQMRIGRVVNVARRDHANRSVMLGGRMDSIFGPLDVTGLDLYARVGAVQAHFNMGEYIEKRRFAQAKVGDGVVESASREEHSYGEIALATYRANPAAYDFVDFETDAWVMEMVQTTT
jgi:hypothetical protein